MSWSAEHLALAACGLALVVAAPAQAAGELYTVAGTGRPGPLGDGGPAAAASIGPYATVAALPDGGFVIGERGRVRAVDAAGRIRTLAGTGKPGISGDGGPATRAQVDPTDLAVAADGSLLITQCEADPKNDFNRFGRVRRIAGDGTITTVAGGSRDEPVGDGGPASAASLSCPVGVAATPDGGFVVADGDNENVRRVDASGTITTIAGTGELPQERLSGSRPGRQVPMSPRDVAVTSDGRVLVADDWACVVLELRPDGLTSVVAGTGAEEARRDDGRQAVSANVCPTGVAAQADGGFIVADEGFSRLTGEQPRVRRVAPDGRIATWAGSGRFVPNPPRGLERRGDGEPARRADLRPITDIALMPDGGVLIAEGIDEEDTGVQGLIRYLAPTAPGRLATAIARGSDRVFAPGRPAAVTVSSTAAANVTLTVRGVGAVTVAVQAGRTRVALPALRGRIPHRVDLVAIDGAGRVAADRTDLYPRGWLAREVAEYAARGLAFRATGWSGYSGDALTGCRRFSATRLDCGLDQGGAGRCQVAVTIRLGADRRLRWGAYRCPLRSRPRLHRRVRPFAARDRSCESSDTSCPSFAGVLSDRRLIPWG